VKQAFRAQVVGRCGDDSIADTGGSGGSDMRRILAATAVAATVFAPAALFAQTSDGNAPVKPGAVRITTKNPDADKWDGQKSANGSQRIFKCKPLACPDAETVSFTFLKSPTRHPDPQALEKFAKVDLPKGMRALDAAREALTEGTEKFETLSSKTATLKTYPAVVNESKISGAAAAAYVETAIIFAGPAMIRIQSVSANQELAQKSLDQFIEAMTIAEGPPPTGEPAQPTGPGRSPTTRGT
jgi:hypothetical protein